MKEKKIRKIIEQSDIEIVENLCDDNTYICDYSDIIALFRLGMKTGIKKERKSVNDWLQLLDHMMAEVPAYPTEHKEFIVDAGDNGVRVNVPSGVESIQIKIKQKPCEHEWECYYHSQHDAKYECGKCGKLLDRHPDNPFWCKYTDKCIVQVAGTYACNYDGISCKHDIRD